MKKYLWLVLAGVVGIIGIVVGRALRLPEFAAVPLAVFPAMLVIFPFMKRWMPQAKFRYWAMAVGLGAFFTWLFYFAFAKLGWT